MAAGGAGYIADLAEAVHFTSRPVEAVSAAGAPRTLRDALQGILVELLPSASSPEGGGSADSAAAADGGSGGGGACENRTMVAIRMDLKAPVNATDVNNKARPRARCLSPHCCASSAPPHAQ